jgi:hypothetical protein
MVLPIYSVMKGIDVERKAGFDLCSSEAELFDRHRLEDHRLAEQISENLKALRLALVGFHHPARL